jgi:hypothetical protein
MSDGPRTETPIPSAQPTYQRGRGPFAGFLSGYGVASSRADMKRGFLFGLGSSLCVGVLLGLMQLSNDVITAAIILAISVPLSILVIYAANRAPPNRSRAHGLIGWLVGFLIIDAALLCIFGVIVIFSNLS